MTLSRKLLLLAASLAVLLAVSSVSPVVIVDGTVLQATDTETAFAPVADLRTLAAWLTGILLSTGLLYAALAPGDVAKHDATDARLTGLEKEVSRLRSDVDELLSDITEPPRA